MSAFVWREVTRDCHVASIGDVSVVTVERRQKRRPNGTKHEWQIVVLDDPWAWGKHYGEYDPRDLESAKSAAEKRAKAAIGWLYRVIRS